MIISEPRPPLLIIYPIKGARFAWRVVLLNVGADADSGFKIRFHFCPNCGSTTSWHWLPEWAGSNVLWEGDRNPNTYGIAVGSFADPNFPPPTYSAWEEVMHPWLGLVMLSSGLLCRSLIIPTANSLASIPSMGHDFRKI
jgi:hypothetical protein